MSNITDKVVVITGASSGIGEGTAKLLAEQGAKVVLGARRLNRINAVVQEISATGGKAIGFACDDGRAADGTAFPKYPLHDDLTWRDCYRAVGAQFGRSDQKEFARVHENGHPGQRDRQSDCLRNR